MHLVPPKDVVHVSACLLISLAVGCGGSPPQNSVSPTSNATPTTVSVTPSGAAPNPVTSARLVANPVSIDFGSVQVGTSTAQTLVLSNTGTAEANISSLTTTDPAFRVTVPALPFTLSAGFSVTSQVQFVPSGAGNFNTTLAVAAAGAPTITVALAGAGIFAPTPTPTPTPGQHLATLAWGASSSVVDGYNVYRSSTSGGPYTRINAAPVTALIFGDTNVAAGQTYYYVVTGTVAGVESPYSNEARAIIPSP
jgi:Abnormal spindle-like microcephaly-assoc'd, ASPM-SPD-2-Hydin